MPKIDWTVSQGSVDWSAMRAVIPTASEFANVMTPKRRQLAEGRKKYACRIIAARLLNWQPDSLDRIRHIEEGKQKEPLAVGILEAEHGIKTRPVGFVTTNDGRWGASPDRLVMSGDAIQMAIECKCPTIPTQFEYLLYGHDDAYACQVQGQLLVCETDKAIFHSFHERTPPYTIQTDRDEGFIRDLTRCLDQFSDELETLYLKAKSLGDYQEFERWLTPVEKEAAPDDEAVQRAIDANYDWGA